MIIEYSTPKPEDDWQWGIPCEQAYEYIPDQNYTEEF